VEGASALLGARTYQTPTNVVEAFYGRRSPSRQFIPACMQ
jgi:hypothetical protein